MPEEIFPGLYRLKIPLPESPLKFLNSYIIKGPDKNLLIDTGLNRKECLEAMQDGLAKLKVDLKKTDIFITHLHADHFGLVGQTGRQIPSGLLQPARKGTHRIL